MYTKREKEVIILLIEGKSNIEIAECLNVSIHTVKAHLEHIYAKNEICSEYKNGHRKGNARIDLIIKLAKTNSEFFQNIKQ